MWQQTAYLSGLAVLCTLGLAATSSPFDEDVNLPRFRWGQTRERLFVTIVVRDLDKDSVSVEFSQEGFTFTAADNLARPYALQPQLVQDIVTTGCKWEHLKRRDRWGDAVLLTMPKLFPSSWEALVEEPVRYRQVMDRDWARDDGKLEADVEDTYQALHREYLQSLTADELDEALEGVEAVVVVVRHSACEMCKHADETFAATVRNLSTTRPAWAAHLRLALVDARTERVLTRRCAHSCAATPLACRHCAFFRVGGQVEMLRVRTRHEEETLRADLEVLSRQQFTKMSAAEAQEGRGSALRGLAVLRHDAAPEVTQAAHRVRLRMDLAVVASDADAAALGLTSAVPLVAWTPKEAKPQAFQGLAQDAEAWLRVRALALLARTATFIDDEPYEETGLPVARLYLAGGPLDAAAQAAAYGAATLLLGRAVFVERDATNRLHEWRSHGLPPDCFPAFAVAQGQAHNATKHAFLEPPCGMQEGAEAFWTGPARERLTEFVEAALRGDLEPSYMSEAPNVSEATGPGSVRRLVGRQCRRAVEEAEGEALVEGYDEWRRDHADRTLRTDVLAPVLARWNITVFRFDFGYNECPPNVMPTIAAGYSGYFFIPQDARRRGLQIARLKKLDPPYERVLKFILKHNKAKFDPVSVLEEVNSTVLGIQRQQAIREFARDWSVPLSVVVGGGGLLTFYLARCSWALPTLTS